MSSILHVKLGCVLPFELENAVFSCGEELVVLRDSLLFGPLSQEVFYDPHERHLFWDQICAGKKHKTPLNALFEEKEGYDLIKKHVQEGGTLTIWYSDNPNDILLLWSLCFFCSAEAKTNAVKIQIGHYSEFFELDSPLRQLSSEEIQENAMFWSFLVEENLDSLKKYTEKSAEVEIVCRAKAVDIDQILFEQMTEQIIANYLSNAPEYRTQRVQMVGEILGENRWIPDFYLLHRWDTLMKERTKNQMKKNDAKGFTLLEVIIVFGLLLVIISMIWSILQVYSAYYISGTRRVERSQLVRSISQLLSEDLNAAIQDPIHPLAPTSEADDSVRRFGLLGTNTSLRVDVIQINPLDPTGKPTAKRRAAMGPVQNVPMQVPELKTIFYDFVPISSTQTTARSTNSQQHFGLMRREISFEAPDESGSQSLSAEDMENTDSAAVATVRGVGDWSLDQSLRLEPIDESFDNTAWQEEGSAGFSFPGADGLTNSSANQLPANKQTISEQLSQEDDPNRMWAPEVVEFSLRYSDGKNWLNDWDSIEKNGLPIAVEVKLSLMPLVDIEAIRKSPLINKTQSPIPNPQSISQLCAELGIAQPMEQRVVVFLSGSPLLKNEPFRRPASPPIAKSPSATVIGSAPSALTTGPTPTLTAPSIAPPPVSPAPATPKPTPPKPTLPSQQWIRK